MWLVVTSPSRFTIRRPAAPLLPLAQTTSTTCTSSSSSSTATFTIYSPSSFINTDTIFIIASSSACPATTICSSSSKLHITMVTSWMPHNNLVVVDYISQLTICCPAITTYSGALCHIFSDDILQGVSVYLAQLRLRFFLYGLHKSRRPKSSSLFFVLPNHILEASG